MFPSWDEREVSLPYLGVQTDILPPDQWLVLVWVSFVAFGCSVIEKAETSWDAVSLSRVGFGSEKYTLEENMFES